MSVAKSCFEVLRLRHQTLATAESLTAGLIAATFADVPGASDVLRGGLTAYATEVKSTVLGVDPAVIAREGVVSAACAEAMAALARKLFASDWAVSATGVAGPTEQDGVRVGSVFVAAAGPRLVTSRQWQFDGDRGAVRSQSVDAAFGLLLEVLEVTA